MRTWNIRPIAVSSRATVALAVALGPRLVHVRGGRTVEEIFVFARHAG